MNKPLIRVRVPALHTIYEVRIPDETEIGTVSKLLASGIQELSMGQYVFSGNEMLIDEAKGRLLNPKETLKAYDIADGEQLILL